MGECNASPSFVLPALRHLQTSYQPELVAALIEARIEGRYPDKEWRY